MHRTSFAGPGPRLLILLVACIGVLAAARPAAAATLTTQRKKVVEDVAAKFVERYVFEDRAKRTADHLRQRAKRGASDAVADTDALAAKLTAEIRAVDADRHIEVDARAVAPASAGASPPGDRLRWLERLRRRNYDFARVKRLPGNVAYLDLRSFPPPEVAVAGLAAVSAAHAQSPAPAAASDPAADKRLADSFMAAIAGDGPARERWIEAHVADKPFMPKAEFKPVMEGLAKVSGLKAEGFNRRGRWLEIFVMRADGKAAEVDLDMDPADGAKIKGLIPIASPGRFPKPLVAAPVGEARLKAAIAERVKWSAGRDDFSGAVLVMKGDRVIYTGAYGLAEKDNRSPITVDTRFHLGSMDKQFTSVAIGQLIEAGKLSLDTRLIEVLPDYPNKDAAAKITIHHLLTHTAGLGRLFDREAWQRDKLKPFARVTELLPMFAAEPLQFEPGKDASYANEGFLVLGAVVEKLSGQSWYDYVTANVFARAGMAHTGWPAIDEITPGRAVGYRFGDDDPLGFGQRRPNWNSLGYRGNSCGGGYSTVGDMVKFLQALRAGQLLKPETVELFTTAHEGGIGRYGMGFQRISEGGKTIRGHDGGGPSTGVNSDAKMVWETQYAYAVMGNYDAPFAEAVGDDIAKMLAAQP